MTWFTLLKGQVYYHIASPEITKQIVEHQMIPKDYFGFTPGIWGQLPWVKENIENKKKLGPSKFIQQLRGERKERHDKLLRMSPNVPAILFWKDLDDAKAFYHSVKFNAQMEDVEDDTKAEMLKCDIDVKCIPFPRPIAIHTPTERKPNFPRQNMHDRWMNPNTGKLEGSRTYRGAFNTELLHSGYYHPIGEEDIPGKFEVVSI